MFNKIEKKQYNNTFLMSKKSKKWVFDSKVLLYYKALAGIYSRETMFNFIAAKSYFIAA